MHSVLQNGCSSTPLGHNIHVHRNVKSTGNLKKNLLTNCKNVLINKKKKKNKQMIYICILQAR